MRNPILALILIALLLHSANAQVLPTAECDCKCYGEEIKESATSEEICYEECGRKCGARAGFTKDCITNCNTVYCVLDPDRVTSAAHTTELIDGCKAACKQRCELNSLIIGPSGIVTVLRYGIMLIAATIFAICALRFLLSDDPGKRTEAKKCFIYVITGVIIVGAASLIPRVLLISGGAVEPRLACSSCEECTAAIEAAVAGELVILMEDIKDRDGTCIIWENDNVGFTCNGHVIDGDGDNDGLGISISNHKGNKISYCEITEFDVGINLDNAEDMLWNTTR